MRKFIVPSVMAASLGAAMMFSLGTPYEAAARNLEISRLECSEVLKQAYRQGVMRAAEEQPELPPGMVVVMPRATRA